MKILLVLTDAEQDLILSALDILNPDTEEQATAARKLLHRIRARADFGLPDNPSLPAPSPHAPALYIDTARWLYRSADENILDADPDVAVTYSAFGAYVSGWLWVSDHGGVDSYLNFLEQHYNPLSRKDPPCRT